MKLSPDKLKIMAAVGTLVGTWILFILNRIIFRKIYRVRKLLYIRFFERIFSAVILGGGLFLALSSYGGFQTIWKTMLGGTAIVSAVLIFAAQDIIRDILAGLMISLFNPFEIGNRIQLENGTTGIVRDITMRHVVLQLQDTQVSVIPNSKLNVMSIVNFSYKEQYRSAMFTFRVAYRSDVQKAIQVIRQAIMESTYSIPAKDTDHGKDYAPVYFMAYEDSSLRLTTTVYYEASSPSEVVISDINLRVDQALKENGVEVPYPYINVVQKT